ncbi:MAG: pilus assembly protein N-terminal domain-containing protein [Cyanobacteria bacterium HKST-UBA02]|nr:pilus assembly protein N-terminal domain-containing protein [Cyanobacteria bacterium HKST-UBA02]
MAGATESKTQAVAKKKAQAPKTTNKKVKTVAVAKRAEVKSLKQDSIQLASSELSLDDSAMLFLPGRGKNAGALGGGPAPAAALSIHPALPTNIDTPDVAPAPSTHEAPSVAEESADLPSESTPAPGEDLIAQMSADNLLAQGESGDVNATPIPPVVTGTVDLEEFKTTNVIDVKVSRSRTFKLRNKIVRTSISDPGIVEPVVVSENQMVLLGKSPGKATMVIWDDAGNSAAIEVSCSRDYSQLQATLREIDPRIIVKTYSVGGSDRLILLGDVDHAESVIRAFSAANVFMDDRGMNVQVANNRLVDARIGEMGAQGGGNTSGGGRTGQLAQLSSVDRYTFFPNTNNNVSLAQGIVSDGGRITSLIKIRKVPLIVLHVTFMEMNTTAARTLATSLGFNYTGPGVAFGLGGSAANTSGAQPYLQSFGGIYERTPVFQAGTTAVGSTQTGYATGPVAFFSPTGVTATGIGQPIFASPITALLTGQTPFGSPGGAAFQSGGLGNLFTALSNFAITDAYRFSVNPSIQGLITHNRARILAEPTLVCISGERASFLAGGEIPIFQAIATAGNNQVSVTFEPFGLRINMIPVLQENGSLNLEVSPEERVISQTFALQLTGTTNSIPGFTTRKAQTIVEMKPGQELYISGLITSNSGRSLDKYPIFGEIPVLGALWRSKAFNKNESELVIAIRPEIILPGTPGQLKLPEEIGRVEGPRDMNIFQVEPTVLDERHYTSGRSERHQKTSPTLPEGAPIPDNR